jgi:hypothetical protein
MIPLQARIARIAARTGKAPYEVAERAQHLYRAYEKGRRSSTRVLTKALLAVNGDFALVPERLDVYERFITKKPEVRSGRGARVLKLAPGKCHSGAAELHRLNPKYAVATGFALDQDDEGFRLWRQHSWNVDTRTGRIVEVTGIPRERYWGRVLSPRLTRRLAFFECDARIPAGQARRYRLM